MGVALGWATLADAQAPLRTSVQEVPGLVAYAPTTGSHATGWIDPTTSSLHLTTSPAWEPGWSVTPARLDRDGLTDALLYHQASGEVQIAWQTPTGWIRRALPYAWAPGWHVTVVDVDADGLDDFILYNPLNGVLVAAVSDGAGGFAYRSNPASEPFPLGAQVLPIRLAGEPRPALLLYQPASGAWTRHRFLETPGTLARVDGGSWEPGWFLHEATLDGDGDSDLLVYSPPSGRWIRLATQGGGVPLPVASGWTSPGAQAVVADFDGDGLSDLLTIAGAGAWTLRHSPAVATSAGTERTGVWPAGHVPAPVDLDGTGGTDLLLTPAHGGDVLGCRAPLGESPCTPLGSWPDAAHAATRVGQTIGPLPATDVTWAPDTLPGRPIRLSGETGASALLYDPVSGLMAAATSPAGTLDVDVSESAWGEGWSVVPARLDGDALTDALLYHPATGQVEGAWRRGADWHRIPLGIQWAPGWTIQAADVTLDGLDDFLLYNPRNGVWVLVVARGGGQFTYHSGTSATRWPLAAQVLFVHHDADARPDVLVYAPATGEYLRLRSRGLPEPGLEPLDQGRWEREWVLLPARLDDDGLTDLLVYARQTGRWVRLASRTDTAPVPVARGWWAPGGHAVVGEFTGDHRSDLLVYYPASGAWRAELASEDPRATVAVTGQWRPARVPVVLDLDGDTLSDVLLYAERNGQVDACASPLDQRPCAALPFWSSGWLIASVHGAPLTRPAPLPAVTGAPGVLGGTPLTLAGDGSPGLVLYDATTGIQVVASVDGDLVDGLDIEGEAWEPGWMIVPARLDRDALTDALLYHPDTGAVQVAWRRGGSWVRQPMPYVWAPGWRLVAADFSADGLDDILLYNPRNGVWVLALADGAGAFTYHGDAQRWPLDANVLPVHLDDDGRLDVIVHVPATGRLARLSGRVSPSVGFTALGEHDLGVRNAFLWPARLDDDDLTDLVAYAPLTGQWLRLLGRSEAAPLAVAGGWTVPGAVLSTGDFTGDRLTDVLFVHPGTGAWRMAVAPADPTTAPAETTGTWWPGFDAIVIDLDGDARSDVLLHDRTTGQVRRCLAPLGGTTSCKPLLSALPAGLDRLSASGMPSRVSPIPSGPAEWAPDTLGGRPLAPDGSGRATVIAYSPANGSQRTVLVDPGHAGGLRLEADAWESGWIVTPARLDGDGLTDAVLYNPATGAVKLAWRRAGGWVRQSAPYAWAPGWLVTAADFSGDGLDDLLLYNPRNGVHVVAVSDGSGGFAYHGGPELWPLDADVLPVHLDEDGRLDVVVHEPAIGRLTRLLARSTPAPGFTAAGQEMIEPGLRLWPARLNDDAVTDLVGYAPPTGRWLRLLGEPGAAFAPVSSGWTVPGAILRTGEFTGDHRTDVLLSYPVTGTWRMAPAPAEPETEPTETAGSWAQGFEPFVIDLDGDAGSDVLLVHPATGQMQRCLAPLLGTLPCSALSVGVPLALEFATTSGGPIRTISLRLSGPPVWSRDTTPGTALQFGPETSSGLLLHDAQSGTTAIARLTPTSGAIALEHTTWEPGWVVVPARLDRDGETDALLYSPETGAVQIARRRHGSWVREQMPFAWAPGWHVTAVDLDADGVDDFLLYNARNGVWVQVLSDGTGGFSYRGNSATLRWALGAQVLPLHVDADGLPDVVVYHPPSGAFTRYRHRGEPEGGYVELDSGWWGMGWTLHRARLDDDDLTDLLAYAPATGQSARLHSGVTAMAWQAAQHPANGVSAVGEFTGDHRTDLLVYRPSTGEWWLTSQARGAGESTTFGGAWPAGRDVAAADMDGDGLTDVVLQDPASGEVTICRAPLDVRPCDAPATWGPDWTMADRVGADTSAGLGDARLRRGLAPVTFTQPVEVGLPMFPAVWDIDGDGWLDVAGFRNTGTGALVPVDLEAAGLGGYLEAIAGGAIRDTRVADLTGDGLPDLVTNVYSTDGSRFYARLYVNRGDGTFAADPDFDALRVTGFGESLVVADFDNDGDLDVFVPHYTHNDPTEQNYLLVNDGHGKFTDRADAAGVAMRNWPESIKVEGAQAVDFDGDGWLDLYVASAFFFNQGNLTFIDRREALGLPARFDEGLKFLDWNNDGHLDLLMHNPWAGPLLYQSDGATFTLADVLPHRDWPINSYGLNIYDLDNDGREDIVLSGGWTRESPILRNVGTRFVENPWSTITNFGNDATAFGDFDRDGRIDLVRRVSGVTLAWALNTTPTTGTHVELEIVDDDGRRNQFGRVVRLSPVDEPGLVMTRVVDGGSGLLSQNQYTLLVGLPRAVPHVVRVRFDSGERTFTVEPGQRLRLYRDGRVAPLP